MYTNKVHNSTRNAINVADAVITNQQIISQKLIDELTSYVPEGQTLPDMEIFQQTMARLLREKGKIFHQLERDTHTSGKAALKMKVRRDELRRKLRVTLITLRETYSAAYGTDATNLFLGISGPTPERPDKLVTHARNVMDALSRPAMPTPLVEGNDLDPAPWRAWLEPDTVALEENISHYNQHRRATQMALVQRNELAAAYHQKYQAILQILVGLYRLGGQKDLADRLPIRARRPSTADKGEPNPQTDGDVPQVPEPPPEG